MKTVLKWGFLIGLILTALAIAFLTVVEWDLRGELAAQEFENKYLDFNPEKKTNEIPIVGSCEVVIAQCNLQPTIDPQLAGKNE